MLTMLSQKHELITKASYKKHENHQQNHKQSQKIFKNHENHQ